MATDNSDFSRSIASRLRRKRQSAGTSARAFETDEDPGPARSEYFPTDSETDLDYASKQPKYEDKRDVHHKNVSVVTGSSRLGRRQKSEDLKYSSKEDGRHAQNTVETDAKKISRKSCKKKDNNQLDSKLDVKSSVIENAIEETMSVDVPGDVASDSSSDDDWEEVEDAPMTDTLPVPESTDAKELKTVSISLPAENSFNKKKKKSTDSDVQEAFRQILNRFRKRTQENMHKVHLLCLLNYGQWSNKVCCDNLLLAMTLSILPVEFSSKPADEWQLSTLIDLANWLRQKFVINKQLNPSSGSDFRAILLLRIAAMSVANCREHTLLFVLCCRSIGLQTRLVYSLQPVSFKPNDLLPKNANIFEVMKDQKQSSPVTSTKSDVNPAGSLGLAKVEKKFKKLCPKDLKRWHEMQKKVKIETSASDEIDCEPVCKGNSEIRSSQPLVADDSDRMSVIGSRSNNVELLVNDVKHEEPIEGSRNSDGNQPVDAEESIVEDNRKTKHSRRGKGLTVRRSNRSGTQPLVTDDSDKKFVNGHSSNDIELLVEDVKNPERLECSRNSDGNKQVDAGESVENDKKTKHSRRGKDSRNAVSKPVQKLEAIKQVDGKYDDSSDSSSSSELGTVEVKKQRTTGRRSCTKKVSYAQSEPDSDFEEDETKKPKHQRKTIRQKAAPKRKSVKNSIPESDEDFTVEEVMYRKKTEDKPQQKKQRHKATDTIIQKNTTGQQKKQHGKATDTIIQKSTTVQRKTQRGKATGTVIQKNSTVSDWWAEVYLRGQGRWIPVSSVNATVDNILSIEASATDPLSYVLAFDSDGSIKDVTKKYAKNWLTSSWKLREDETWWQQVLLPFESSLSKINEDEDQHIEDKILSQPMPTSIGEFKNHPLYVLQRHLLKFEAIYPPSAVPLGYIREEPIFARECVQLLHAREKWIQEGKVVKDGEEPYKIVKARPKWNKPKEFNDNLKLPLFGHWQTEQYRPPPAVDGKVPVNGYGNVDLFKPWMLPPGTVHLKGYAALNRVARKLGIDCPVAMTGWDFHGGVNHPVFDGWVVCTENADVLVAAWEEEQAILREREREKRQQVVYDNWKRLIKGLLIKERLKRRFGSDATTPMVQDEDSVVGPGSSIAATPTKPRSTTAATTTAAAARQQKRTRSDAAAKPTGATVDSSKNVEPVISWPHLRSQSFRSKREQNNNLFPFEKRASK